MSGDIGWAVVTGASSGIGAALARGLAAGGHDLLLVARRAEPLQRLADELIREHGGRVEIRARDLADRDQRDELCDELAGLRIAVLCANAGFPTCGPLADNDPALEAAEIEVNVVAVHRLVTVVLPGMLARRAGRILVTGSNAGEQPVPTAATYAATKAFANTFAQSLHGELHGTGVSCTLLEPGPVRTEFFAVGGVPALQRHRWLGWQTPDRVAARALAGLARGRRVVFPGFMAAAQTMAGRYLPRAVLFPVLRTVFLPMLRDARTSETNETSEPIRPPAG